MSTQRDGVAESPTGVPGGNAVPGERQPLRGRGRGHSRRQGASRAVSVAAVAAAVALVLGATTLLRIAPSEPLPADVPFEALHLPTVVNTPGTWSDDEGPTGPLAALGLAIRTEPEGLTGERQQLQMFGVSAVDGRSAWIDLPGVRVEDEALIGWFALSPDGRWIGWSRHERAEQLGEPAPLLGWAVMDTTTRRVRELADPAAFELRETASELVFSGDSRYLLTSYERPSSPQRRGHRFVAWDVENGTPTALEEPGHYWLPSPGSASTGVVWSRGSTVYRETPATAERSSYSLPQSIVTASWAPDDTAFAYIGSPVGRSRAPWRLYAGPTLDKARNQAVPLPVRPGQILGWRDDRHVVVDHFRRTVHVVDVVTGDVEELDLAGYGEPMNVPLLATDLWRNPLGEPAEPDGTTDPRRPFRWGGGALLALLAGSLLVRRRRTRA